MFTKKDITQIEDKGIKLTDIETQIENFRNGFPYVKLVGPATAGNGIVVLSDKEVEKYENYFNKLMTKTDIIKFIPASGAATRMFKHLYSFSEKYDKSDKAYKEFLNDQSFDSVYSFITGIENFAFFNILKEIMEKDGFDPEKCVENRDYDTIIKYVLSEKGLNYNKLPKGLIRFHDYEDGARMSVEEHLVETAHYCKNKNNRVPIHFTVSPEHYESFLKAIETYKPKYEKQLGVVYDISFSFQKPSTDIIAVDMDNNPYREKDDTLLFRPGGHGALIENLNELKNDIVFIKNIDNIVPDKYREPTYVYKKALGGYLLKLRDSIFENLQKLHKNGLAEGELEEVADFAINDLNIDIPRFYNGSSFIDKRDFLISRLNRPVRVCGMVKNEGEPGGGPYWVKRPDGEISLQIVEKSQIDIEDSGQVSILNHATHFNPVDLVCSIRNYKGENFHLKKYIDPTTGFISIKSKDGKNLKAQELPGLWNGAMADWITIFIETPIITFNPVKTVNDLLRSTHQ